MAKKHLPKFVLLYQNFAAEIINIMYNTTRIIMLLIMYIYIIRAKKGNLGVATICREIHIFIH